MKAFLRHLLNSIREDAYYERSCEGRGTLLSYVHSVYGHVHWLVGAIVCHFLDHAWEDASHAGPESGNMDMYCSRCGKTFHHQLY